MARRTRSRKRDEGERRQCRRPERSVMDITTILNDSDDEPGVSGEPREPSQPRPTQLAIRITMSHLTAAQTTGLQSMQSRRPMTAEAEHGQPRRQTEVDAEGTDSDQRRAGRPAYTLEHAVYLWYHRDDLNLEWNEVVQRFVSHFGERRLSGIQCKYYRIRDHHNAPPVRASRRGNRDRSQDPVPYGVVWCSDYRYPWMLPHHQRFPAPRP